MVRSAGIGGIRHEGGLVWFDLADNPHVFAEKRVSLYIKFDSHYVGELINIGIFYVAFVWSRVDGYAICAGFDYRLSSLQNIRYPNITLVPQQCNLI